jgi:hypothetical protein
MLFSGGLWLAFSLYSENPCLTGYARIIKILS